MKPGTQQRVEYSFTTEEGDDVSASVDVRWEDDLFGPGTVWVADYSAEPYRRDGESDGLLSIEDVRSQVVAAHRNG